MHWEGEGRSDEHSARSRVPSLLQEATGTQTTLLMGDFRGSVEAAPIGATFPTPHLWVVGCSVAAGGW